MIFWVLILLFINLFDSLVTSSFLGVQHIPYSFARDYLPQESTEITLIGPDGVDWKVKYVVVNSRAILTIGWISFARYYALKVNDTCWFEVVNPLELKVRIM